MKDNKTIGVTVRFFTNDLPKKVGHKQDLTPCWASGSVHVEANKGKGISSRGSVTFNGIKEIPEAIRRAMSAARIVTVTKNV